MARQNADRQIAEMLEKYGEEWNDATVWRVQGTAVIGHKALERIAAKAGIVFRPPTILRAERDEAVILVTGAIGDNEEFREEWSIGEALIVREGTVGGNYKVSGKQASYPYAMAEKRAKDRVILKLVNLHGLAYSEEEADEFRQPQAENRNAQIEVRIEEINGDEYRTASNLKRRRGERLPESDSIIIRETLVEAMSFARNRPSLSQWLKGQQRQIDTLQDADFDAFWMAFKAYRDSLPEIQQEAA